MATELLQLNRESSYNPPQRGFEAVLSIYIKWGKNSSLTVCFHRLDRPPFQVFMGAIKAKSLIVNGLQKPPNFV